MQIPADTTPANARAARLKLALERELRPDEIVVWHGWQLGRLDPRSFMIYVFAVPWTAFSVMWTIFAAAAVSSTGSEGAGLIGWAFPLFGLPFIVIGLGMLAAPFWPAIQQGRVLYVVTDSRVLKLSLGRALTVTIIPADRIGLAERREHRDGTGTLTLAVKIGKDIDGDRQTENFVIGLVADVMGAQAAVSRIGASLIAAPGAKSPRPGSA